MHVLCGGGWTKVENEISFSRGLGEGDRGLLRGGFVSYGIVGGGVGSLVELWWRQEGRKSATELTPKMLDERIDPDRFYGQLL